MSDWKNVPDDISVYYGFVYEIKNTINDRKYIGKKFFFVEYKKPPLKKSGKKRMRKFREESNWKEYYGSCNELNADIEKYGKEVFERKILTCCFTRFDCAYEEIRLQIEKEVLYKKEYYNGIINCRLRAPTKK